MVRKAGRRAFQPYGVTVQEVKVQDLGFRWGLSVPTIAFRFTGKLFSYLHALRSTLWCMSWHMRITRIIPQTSGSSWSSIYQTGVGEKIGWRRMEFRLRVYKTQPFVASVSKVSFRAETYSRNCYNRCPDWGGIIRIRHSTAGLFRALQIDHMLDLPRLFSRIHPK